MIGGDPKGTRHTLVAGAAGLGAAAGFGAALAAGFSAGVSAGLAASAAGLCCGVVEPFGGVHTVGSTAKVES